MPFTIDEEYLPAILTAPPMSDEQFAKFAAEHEDYFIEMTAEGEIIVMPPNYTLTGIRNGEINRQLGNWALRDGRGTASDASTGFVLPNGARRSPDAAWTDGSRVEKLSDRELQRYWHLCPDFVIELRSQTDRLPTLRAKMLEWVGNGAQLAWLVDPERRAVEIFRPEGEAETRMEVERLDGEGPVTGFTLELGRVWEPLAK